ncbi:MAG: hypothetical protein AB8F74_12315 [Saprospiraceae bacterium]
MKIKSKVTRKNVVVKVQGLFFVFVIVLLGIGCSQNTEAPKAAFYHWKTKLNISPSEASTMNQIAVKKLYVKFFDLDINSKKEATPLAVLQCQEKLQDSLQIIPTIFITNRTLQNTSTNSLPKLAEKILLKINSIWPSVSNNQIQEIQLDCDWTPSTQKKYFQLLTHFQNHLAKAKIENCELSATIRLHQIKYAQKTGVPPVDRGMLMFYNMDGLENLKTENSILNLKVAKQYLNSSTSYELPLDMALPIFRWGVLFRNDKMIKLINNLEEADLRDNTRFEKTTSNHYIVKKSTYLKAYYLYEDDVIRLESVQEKELVDAAEFLNKIFSDSKRTDDEVTVSFYQLDTTILKHYSDETLEQVLYEFSK